MRAGSSPGEEEDTTHAFLHLAEESFRKSHHLSHYFDAVMISPRKLVKEAHKNLDLGS